MEVATVTATGIDSAHIVLSAETTRVVRMPEASRQGDGSGAWDEAGRRVEVVATILLTSHTIPLRPSGRVTYQQVAAGGCLPLGLFHPAPSFCKL